MKTEDLKAQGLTDEQITFVMAENGKDIKTLQDENATLKTEKTQLETEKNVLSQQITDRDKTIQNLQTNSITKQQHDQEITELKDQIAKEQEKSIRDGIIASLNEEFGVIDTEENKQALNFLLEIEKQPLDKEKKEITGLRAKYEALQKSNPQYFNSDLKGLKPGGTGGNSSDADDKDISLAAEFAKEANKTQQGPTESKFFN